MDISSNITRTGVIDIYSVLIGNLSRIAINMKMLTIIINYLNNPIQHKA